MLSPRIQLSSCIHVIEGGGGGAIDFWFSCGIFTGTVSTNSALSL